jgi:restriction system protein
VKLRMAENSLFAILLRAPWWISLAIALGLALLARLLLPERFAAVGAFGVGFPFVVIAAIAAWRQLRAPSPRAVEAALARLRTLGTAELLAAAEAAWRADGWQVQRCNAAGADLLRERAGRRELWALRRWKAASHGIEPLRELQGACARHDDAAGVYLHAAAPSDKARDYARDHGLRLVGAADFAQQLLTGGALRG